MKKTEFKIGDVIAVDHKLERVAKDEHRNWIPKKIDPISVYIVGVRTLKNGDMVFNDTEEELNGPDFVATVNFPAIMVTKGLYSRPFFVIHEKEQK